MKGIAVIIISLACIAALVVLGQNTDSVLRVRRNHAWGNDGANGYSSDNAQCVASCTAANGVSCGKHYQNCCQQSACEESWYGGSTCHTRVPVAGCTSA